MADVKWITVVGGALLVAIAGAGLWAATADPPGSAIATMAEIDAMQAQADASCRCARDGKGGGACWTEFDRDLSRYAHEEMASACAEDSSTSICFTAPAGQEIRCISRERPRGACSDGEARWARARAKAGTGC